MWKLFSCDKGLFYIFTRVRVRKYQQCSLTHEINSIFNIKTWIFSTYLIGCYFEFLIYSTEDKELHRLVKETEKHILDYAMQGLRTLCMAKRVRGSTSTATLCTC